MAKSKRLQKGDRLYAPSEKGFTGVMATGIIVELHPDTAILNVMNARNGLFVLPLDFTDGTIALNDDPPGGDEGDFYRWYLQ